MRAISLTHRRQITMFILSYRCPRFYASVKTNKNLYLSEMHTFRALFCMPSHSRQATQSSTTYSRILISRLNFIRKTHTIFLSAKAIWTVQTVWPPRMYRTTYVWVCVCVCRLPSPICQSHTTTTTKRWENFAHVTVAVCKSLDAECFEMFKCSLLSSYTLVTLTWIFSVIRHGLRPRELHTFHSVL